MRIGEIALACAIALSSQASVRDLTTRQVCDLLARSDATTNPARIASALDVLRSRGRGAASAAETLSGLLPHRSRIFNGRDKDVVIRLRAYVIVTLAGIGFPTSARPALLDILAHVDERMSPVEVGAAARAVRSLGGRGRAFTPYLLDALGARLGVEEFSLERFDPRVPAAEATTAQLEIVRTLYRVAPTGDHDVQESLMQLIRDPDRDPRLVREAQRVLDRKPLATPKSERASVPADAAWRPAAQRTRLNLDIAYRDHDGRDGVLGRLVDKPVLITFFYSRCQNSKKCSMAVSRMGALQRQLVQAGMADRVRLLAVSYEPQFDTPERINRFATDRGLRLGPNALALQLDGAREQQLTDELEAPVNFSAGWVNTHGVELSLLDPNGRVVRQYQTILWDNDHVLKDVTRLLAER